MDERIFDIETAEDIQARMLQRIVKAVDKREGSIAYDFTRLPAIEFENFYMYLQNVLDFGFARTTYGPYLDMRAEEVGLSRKEIIKSTGTLSFTGPQGAVIPSGTHVSNETGSIIVETLEEITITNPQITYRVLASSLESGEQFGAPAGTLTVLVSELEVEEVTVWNERAFTEGFNQETDEELKKRYEIRTQNIVAPGNEAYYRLLATSVHGVYDARIYPRHDGVGTLKIVCLAQNKRAPSNAVIETVISRVDSGTLLDVEVAVESVEEVLININVTLTVRDDSIGINSIGATIRPFVEEYLASLAFNDLVVRYSRIGDAILKAEPVLDYENLTINAVTSNITIEGHQVAALGTITITLI